MLVGTELIDFQIGTELVGGAYKGDEVMYRFGSGLIFATDDDGVLHKWTADDPTTQEAVATLVEPALTTFHALMRIDLKLYGFLSEANQFGNHANRLQYISQGGFQRQIGIFPDTIRHIAAAAHDAPNNRAYIFTATITPAGMKIWRAQASGLVTETTDEDRELLQSSQQPLLDIDDYNSITGATILGGRVYFLAAGLDGDIFSFAAHPSNPLTAADITNEGNLALGVSNPRGLANNDDQRLITVDDQDRPWWFFPGDPGGATMYGALAGVTGEIEAVVYVPLDDIDPNPTPPTAAFVWGTSEWGFDTIWG